MSARKRSGMVAGRPGFVQSAGDVCVRPLTARGPVGAMQAMRHSTLIAMLVTLGWTGGVSWAGDETSISPDGEVLHRRLPATPGARSSVPVFVYDPASPGALPREFQRDGVPFAAPSTEAAPGPDEVRYERGGLQDEANTPARTQDAVFDPRGTLGTEALPDRDTEMEGTLG